MYPLETLREDEKQLVCKSIWKFEWSPQSTARLSKYMQYYASITAAYTPELEAEASLRSHQDICNIINLIRIDLTRNELYEFLSNNRNCILSEVDEVERGKILNLVLKACYMVNCGIDGTSVTFVEQGLSLRSWSQNISFEQFIVDSFPLSDYPAINDSNSMDFVRVPFLGRKLKKHAKITFRPTHDLRNHLRFSTKTGILEIFHYTSFVKNHLKLTKSIPPSTNIALPRQLLLEILDSIQKVLFPLSDEKSRSLLRSLTTCADTSFDPDCLRFESVDIRRTDEKNISFLYFGARLMALYEELENPTPRRYMDRWLQKRSGARYIMLATLSGVVFAVLLGFVGLVIAGYQTWITYQAWKHPVDRPQS